MKNIKTFKIIMLSTEKESKIHLWEDEKGKSLHLINKEDSHTRNCQQLYIISDDEIKELDWKYNSKLNLVWQHNRENHSNKFIHPETKKLLLQQIN